MTRRSSPRQVTRFVAILPLVAGLLPAIATVTALLLSVKSGLIPSCNPFLDGCVSISRAARYELPNLIFKALVLPGATLQALTWILCAQWLRCLSQPAGSAPTAISALGLLAGVFFVMYGAFLGSEGETYQWLRRYGINVYFGFTYLCMLLTSARLFHLHNQGWLHLRWNLDRILGVLCMLVLALGLTNLFVKALAVDELFVDRLENSLEWTVSAIFTGYFMLLAWLWHATRFRLRAGCEL